MNQCKKCLVYERIPLGRCDDDVEIDAIEGDNQHETGYCVPFVNDPIPEKYWSDVEECPYFEAVTEENAYLLRR